MTPMKQLIIYLFNADFQGQYGTCSLKTFIPTIYQILKRSCGTHGGYKTEGKKLQKGLDILLAAGLWSI